jgi:cytochrome c
MRKWAASQPADVAAAWAREANESRAAEAPQAKETRPAAPTNLQEQPVNFSPRDHVIWDREVSREVEYGNQLFHDDKLIGSTVGIACAMCHPNASNTHPETYPKFQIQLQRVALLRDMINWCIENPVQGKKLDPDDPKMRALEAYILSQRKGVALDPGKH